MFNQLHINITLADALIKVHGEEMILRNEEGNVLPEKLLDLDSTKDLHPPHHVNPLSGSTISSFSPTYLLEEFADELALITFLSGNDDLQFDIESDLKEIEYLLHYYPIKDIVSILKDSIDQSNLANLNDNLVDSMPEVFTDEHALDYSSPLLYDEYDDDLFEEMDSILKDSVDECNLTDPNNDFVDTILEMFISEHTLDYSSPPLYDDVDDDLVKHKFDDDDVYDDPFDSKEDKIKESKLLIDELDPPRS
nr:hypothetical protein [Tanacetum cinerariifolium]